MSNDTASPLDGAFGYSEASATWSTRYIDPSGFECLLSIEAETGAEALRKAEGALTHLTEAKCLPYLKQGHNGNGHKSTVMVKTDGKNPTCSIHNIEMQKWSKNGRTWYSHRWDDGWCNGKKP